MMVRRSVLVLEMLLLMISSLFFYYSSHIQNNDVLAQTNSLASNDANINDGGDGDSGIAVNTFPIGIAVNPSTNKLYVVNEFSNTVSVIDTNTDAVKSTINLGNFPYGIDMNPLNNRIYITNRGSNTVSVLDGSVDIKLDDITVGKSPVGIAVNPSANWIYVTNLDDGTVSVIDGITNDVIETVSVGKTPYGIAVNPLSNQIYVTDIITNTVTVIDGETNEISAKIPVGKKPTGLAIDIPDKQGENNRLYVANYDSDSVSVIDTVTNKVTSNITSVGDSPVGMAVNAISNKLYVSNIASNTVAVIDTNYISSETGTKNNTALLKEIKVNPTLKTSYSGEDSFVNIPADVGFPLLASQVTIDSFKDRVYVTNTGSNTITIIDGKSNEVAVRLTFNINPPNTGEIRCNNLRVVSGNSTSYNIGQNLQCIATPERGYAFASWSDLANDLRNNPITFKVSEFGTLTANFRPTITPETYVFAIGGIVGATSVFLGWYYKYGQRRYVNRYLTRIESTYDTLHEKDKQQCILQLQSIRRELVYLYKKGSLSDSHYNILDKKTADYIEIVRDERVSS
ncbi:MAG TPA: beta-propeller fold lactonase family protein [Nitrososphaeraceae archaeon]|nr:beta-propeller fold lactonase family protein [Nitrososphaeraceae archaeon]